MKPSLLCTFNDLHAWTWGKGCPSLVLCYSVSIKDIPTNYCVHFLLALLFLFLVADATGISLPILVQLIREKSAFEHDFYRFMLRRIDQILSSVLKHGF